MALKLAPSRCFTSRLSLSQDLKNECPKHKRSDKYYIPSAKLASLYDGDKPVS